MAILGMKKMVLIAHQENRDKLLKTLQQLGAVEVVALKRDGLNSARTPQSLSSLEEKLSAVREALETIRPYDDKKPSMLTPKPPMTRADLQKTPERFAEADKAIQKIKALANDMSALKSRRQRLKNRMAQLEPYARFDTPLEAISESRYTARLLGIIPDNSAEKYEQIQNDYADSAYFETVDTQNDTRTVFVVMHKSVQEKLTGELKFIGFSEAFTKDLTGTPADIIHDCENEALSLEQEFHEYEDKARHYVAHKPLLQSLEDYLVNEIARERSVEQMGETGLTFALEGWVIANDQAKLEKAVLDTAPEAYMHFREPEDDEIPPTALKNSRFVQPFEAVTDMYAVPSPRGFDPNMLMSIFYFIIFGMMIGDFAYGLLLTLGAFVVLRLKKPTGMFKKVTTVIMICGISTAMWGLFFGTIFSIPGVPSVVNPLNDAMTMLIMCLGLGVVHLLVGLGIGAYMLIKQGHIWAAVFDKISWFIVLVGGVMFGVGGALSISIVGTIGTYLAIAGVVILLLTQGRDKKGIVRKAIGGLASLYDVTGYVSDILSYCRIFGMGLATTVIAMVFNTIAGMFMGNVFGYLIGIIVMTAGHVFNIAINTLGAFVHTARLQYIEFFSKFYESGTHTFSPLRIQTKNYRLED